MACARLKIRLIVPVIDTKLGCFAFNIGGGTTNAATQLGQKIFGSNVILIHCLISTASAILGHSFLSFG